LAAAESSYREALRRDASSLPALVNMADFENRRGRYEQAEVLLMRAVAAYPASAEAPWQTVAGVVSDVRQSGLAGDVMPEVYNPVPEDMGDGLSFVIRVTGDPAQLISAVRAAVAGAVRPRRRPPGPRPRREHAENLRTGRGDSRHFPGGCGACGRL
jgi:tetratricopeptide (TPR) repeat protein